MPLGVKTHTYILIVGRKLSHITHVIYYNRISIILLYVTNYMQVTRGDQEKQKYGVRGHKLRKRIGRCIDLTILPTRPRSPW